MTLVLDADSLTCTIRTDFDEACAQLREARLEWRRKDTPGARARVGACLARVDAVLDMWNDTASLPR
jgi:hypothetical protein